MLISLCFLPVDAAEPMALPSSQHAFPAVTGRTLKLKAKTNPCLSCSCQLTDYAMRTVLETQILGACHLPPPPPPPRSCGLGLAHILSNPKKPCLVSVILIFGVN